MEQRLFSNVVSEALANGRSVKPEEVLPVFTDAELLSAVEARGLIVPSLGNAATELAVQSRTGLDEFLNPELPLSPRQELDLQLGIMTEFWAERGYSVPRLSYEQQSSVVESLRARPLHRVVSTPLLDVEGRRQLTNPGMILTQPDQYDMYGRLLADPEGAISVGSCPDLYALRYKTPDGRLVGRADYITALEKAGQAVKAEDGTMWTFPVMDVRVQAPRSRSGETVNHLHNEISPTNTPEALTAMRLLHQANGIQNLNDDVDIANEAIYKLSVEGVPCKKLKVAGVFWHIDRPIIGFMGVNADIFSSDRYITRAEKSGI